MALYAFLIPTTNARSAIILIGLASAFASSTLVLSTPNLSLSPNAPLQGPRLKVIQFNLKPGKDDDTAIVTWLSKERPDLLVLQDLKAPLMHRLSDSMGDMTFNCTLDCEVAVGVRRPIAEKVAVGRGGYGLTPATLIARLDVDGVPATLVATHLARPTFGGKASLTRNVQVQAANLSRLEGLLNDLPRDRMVVVGDFNATPWSWAGRRVQGFLGLERRTSATPTWPTLPWGGALLPIDHVYAGANWKTVEMRRGPSLGSDHYPVVVTLEMASPY